MVLYGNYTGPGANWDEDPEDELDWASYYHDRSYGRMGKKAYLFGSKADRVWLRRAYKSHPKSFRGKVSKYSGMAWFGLKNAFMPSIPEGWEGSPADDDIVMKRAENKKRALFSGYLNPGKVKKVRMLEPIRAGRSTASLMVRGRVRDSESYLWDITNKSGGRPLITVSESTKIYHL